MLAGGASVHSQGVNQTNSCKTGHSRPTGLRTPLSVMCARNRHKMAGGVGPPSIWLDTNVIVYCNPKLLLAAEVPLGRLDADVTEQKLDLFQLATGDVTQTGASPPEIVRCKAAEVGLFSAFTSYISSYAADDPPEPSEEELESTLCTVDCVNACHMGDVFANVM